MSWTKTERNLLQLADKHMRKLEKAHKEGSAPNALKFAYARLQKDLQRLGVQPDKNGKVRMDRKAPDSDRKKRALLNAARTFLSSETSTPAAIKRLERKNLQRFNEKFNTNLNLKQYEAVAQIYERFSGGSYKITMVVQAVEKHDANFLRSLNYIVDDDVDVFGVPAGISSNSDLLSAVLNAMGEDLDTWKTSETLPI